MKAYVIDKYGSGLHLRHLADPVPGPREVLVRVTATSVNPYDWHHMRGEPRVARLLPGLGTTRPLISVPGCDVAGRVAALGPGVTAFRPGDPVYALADEGGFGEYTVVAEDLLAPRPGISATDAAAVPMAGVTALLALGSCAGGSVLVNGASGGVGTFAVQLAKAAGAHVTAVCGTRNLGLLRKIGADEVIDYGAVDFTRAGRRYDLLLDIAGGHPGRALRRALTRTGTLVVVGGPAGRWLQPAGHAFGTLATAPFVRQRIRLADAVHCPDKKALLAQLTALMRAGAVTPVLDRQFAFDEIPAAVRYQEQGHATGKVVVTVGAD
ncbi:NAD(P)-dependent alcohol dehydrogenase [Actinoplanes sp. RD1]|uniref:NAD(P)-dependent alcohol dehydrogenase n=1 Tax=Actinoplanes sp. RD1 TaxID=3064538 RepID=UPI002740C62D|nr:NAD(P)-dependent alcohol dehydrogenase [Actinoplanes sp. RD1]